MAARALEISGDDRAVPGLVAALGKERQVAVRKAVIYALARYPQSPVAVALIPFLGDRKHELRATAAYALAEIADPAAAQPLIEVLRKQRGDKDAFARSQAARGLGRIGSRDAIDPLLQALTNDKSQPVRREAAQALGLIATRQDAKVIEALRAATISADPYLTAAADAAITSINARR
jgi:HEAT repeat protein